MFLKSSEPSVVKNKLSSEILTVCFFLKGKIGEPGPHGPLGPQGPEVRNSLIALNWSLVNYENTSQ